MYAQHRTTSTVPLEEALHMHRGALEMLIGWTYPRRRPCPRPAPLPAMFQTKRARPARGLQACTIQCQPRVAREDSRQGRGIVDEPIQVMETDIAEFQHKRDETAVVEGL